VQSYALALDYGQQIPSLQRLITVSKRTQWATEDIDWERELSKGDYVRILEWQGALRSDYVRRLSAEKKEALARQFVAFDFSQVLHGEQGAMMLAGQLTNSAEDLDAKLFASIQVRDEARHVEAVRGLVRADLSDGPDPEDHPRPAHRVPAVAEASARFAALPRGPGPALVSAAPLVCERSGLQGRHRQHRAR
jgi:hypothetical protein